MSSRLAPRRSAGTRDFGRGETHTSRRCVARLRRAHTGGLTRAVLPAASRPARRARTCGLKLRGLVTLFADGQASWLPHPAWTFSVGKAMDRAALRPRVEMGQSGQSAQSAQSLRARGSVQAPDALARSGQSVLRDSPAGRAYRPRVPRVREQIVTPVASVGAGYPHRGEPTSWPFFGAINPRRNTHLPCCRLAHRRLRRLWRRSWYRESNSRLRGIRASDRRLPGTPVFRPPQGRAREQTTDV